MKNLDQLSKRILAVSLSISLVVFSCSLLIWSATSAHANIKVDPNPYSPLPQTGLGEDYISCGIQDGYAYWVVVSKNGYKFRKSSIKGGHWVSRSN